MTLTRRNVLEVNASCILGIGRIVAAYVLPVTLITISGSQPIFAKLLAPRNLSLSSQCNNHVLCDLERTWPSDWLALSLLD